MREGDCGAGKTESMVGKYSEGENKNENCEEVRRIQCNGDGVYHGDYCSQAELNMQEVTLMVTDGSAEYSEDW